MTVKKYFLAIVIPPPLFEKVEAVKQKLFEQNSLKGALRSPAHITLHRPFEWKEEKENELIETLSAFNFTPTFNVELNNFSFFEPRVIYVDVVPNNDLLNLYNALKLHAKKELKLFNEVNDMRGYHPHVTVAFRDLKKPMFYELKTCFENEKLTGIFAINNFSLLKLEKKWEVLKTFSFNNL
ncbi:MAG: 2'-5' RNA ligase family protein [Bacteroidetes bacterium]|nr:2'-5' RNA ligase family protein [Bacteroidota bacterium]